MHIFLVKHNCFNPFSTNVPLMWKPGSWFLLAKCHSSTTVFKHFAGKNQLTGLSVSGTSTFFPRTFFKSENYDSSGMFVTTALFTS